MHEVLKKLKDISANCCVTVILNTHRTRPDNERDPILLKNLVTDAETRLHNDYDLRFARRIVGRLKKLADTIDHNHNLESIVLFVNEDIAEYARLAVPVENRVVIDNTFATRDLVRATHMESSYYVLVLSQQKARLLEASTDKVVEEVGKPFPIENKTLFSTNKLELSMSGRQTNLVQEFFNRVDKDLNDVRKDHPLPVLVCTEEGNYPQYLQVADVRDSILGHLNKNRLDEKAHHIIAEAWPVVRQIVIDNNKQRVEELRLAVSTGKFLSDFNDIWTAIQHGRAKTLFVQRGYFQPARLVNDSVELVPIAEATQPGVIDDIIDEMIEHNLRFGGDTVFLDAEYLKDFQGLGLITRY